MVAPKTPKKAGRPKADTAPITLRMSFEQIERLDTWIGRHPIRISRPEAIRELLAGVLDQETLDAIDEWRRQQTPPPPMAEAISTILKDWLVGHGLTASPSPED
ncbi:hypothetical protein ACRC7T_06490 [Segnochrobactraceae bacterium EtOH-i3]